MTLLTLLLWSIPLATSFPLQTLSQLIREADIAANPSNTTATKLSYTPLPPSLDPWYRPPLTYDWTQTDPGQVLKIRQAPLLNLTVGNALLAYQLRTPTPRRSYPLSPVHQ